MDINTLNNFKDFKGLNANTIKSFFNNSKFLTFKEGETIYDERICHPYIYLIIDGFVVINKISAHGKERYLYFLSREDFFNQHAIDSRDTTISAKAHTDTMVLQIHKENLLDIMQQDFDFNLMIISVIGKLTRRIQRQLSNTGIYDSKYRLAAKLWKLAKDYGEKVDDNICLTIPLTQFDLSNTLGISRETLNRLLKDMEKENLLFLDGRKIIITNLDDLIKK